MEKVSRITIVVCPDKFGIHKGSVDGPYIRYVVLHPEKGPSVWIDDPTFEDIKNIIYDTSTPGFVVESQCPWCKAREASS